MAYTNANWACVSSSLNQGQETVVPFGGSSTVLNAPNLFVYGSPNDTVATIIAANYFLAEYASLSVGDIIIGNGTDASFAVVVTAVSATSVTVASMGLTTSIGTANILDGAITNAKVNAAAAIDFSKLAALPSADILVGSAGNVATAVAMSGDATISNAGVVTLANNAVTSAKTALNLLQYTTVAITAAEFNGAYGTPKLLIAAPGANKLIVLKQALLAMTFVSAQYAAGGAVAIQYDATVHGAGVHASNSEAAVDFTGAAASTSFQFAGISGDTVGALPFSTTVNKGLYLSNATAAFTTGDSTFVAHLWYEVIPTV